MSILEARHGLAPCAGREVVLRAQPRRRSGRLHLSHSSPREGLGPGSDRFLTATHDNTNSFTSTQRSNVDLQSSGHQVGLERTGFDCRADGAFAGIKLEEGREDGTNQLNTDSTK